jgi:integrase
MPRPDLGGVDLTEGAATASFRAQVDRAGRRQPLKTAESERTVAIPAKLADELTQLKADAATCAPNDFVFATRTGRPIAQRNVLRALRAAQRRAADRGEPTFPALHRTDRRGRPLPPPAGEVPCFHSFRHTAASRAIASGESAEEVAWQLGHRNSVVTRAVYIQEIKSADRLAHRRQRAEKAYTDITPES